MLSKKQLNKIPFQQGKTIAVTNPHYKMVYPGPEGYHFPVTHNQNQFPWLKEE